MTEILQHVISFVFKASNFVFFFLIHRIEESQQIGMQTETNKLNTETEYNVNTYCIQPHLGNDEEYPPV